MRRTALRRGRPPGAGWQPAAPAGRASWRGGSWTRGERAPSRLLRRTLTLPRCSRRPEHLLGLKPSLPDAKLAAHPCRWLSKGDLPKALPGSAQPSGRDWGSAEQPDKQSESKQSEHDAWGASLGSVFADLLELVSVGVGGAAAVKSVTPAGRRRWLRGLRNGDAVRTSFGGRVRQAHVVGWYPGTQALRFRFAGGEREESHAMSALERSLLVQPGVGCSGEFEVFDSSRRGVPKPMESVRICVEIDESTDEDDDASSLAWLPAYIERVDAPSAHVWVRILGVGAVTLAGGRSISIHARDLLFQHTKKRTPEHMQEDAEQAGDAQQESGASAEEGARSGVPAVAAAGAFDWGVQWHDLQLTAGEALASAKSNGGSAPCCFLCHFDEQDGVCGSLRGFSARPPGAEQASDPGALWVHERCLLWCPQAAFGVTFYMDGNFFNMDKLLGYSRRKVKGRHLCQCQICGQIGATISCHGGSARHYSSFHYRCAIDTGWKPPQKPCLQGCEGRCFFCPEHRSSPRRENGSSEGGAAAKRSRRQVKRGARAAEAARPADEADADEAGEQAGPVDADELLARKLQRELTGLRRIQPTRENDKESREVEDLEEKTPEERALQIGDHCLVHDEPEWAGHRPHSYFDVKILRKRSNAKRQECRVQWTTTKSGSSPRERWVPQSRLQPVDTTATAVLAGVTAGAARGAMVGRRVAVYWASEERWYCGEVTAVKRKTADQALANVRVAYDDGETHWGAVSPSLTAPGTGGLLNDDTMWMLGSQPAAADPKPARASSRSGRSRADGAEGSSPQQDAAEPSKKRPAESGHDGSDEDDGHAAWRAFRAVSPKNDCAPSPTKMMRGEVKQEKGSDEADSAVAEPEQKQPPEHQEEKSGQGASAADSPVARSPPTVGATLQAPVVCASVATQCDSDESMSPAAEFAAAPAASVAAVPAPDTVLNASLQQQLRDIDQARRRRVSQLKQQHLQRVHEQRQALVLEQQQALGVFDAGQHAEKRELLARQEAQTGQLVQGIKDARAIPAQLAASGVAEAYRSVVLQTLTQTVQDLQAQLTQLVARQQEERIGFERAQIVARTRFCEDQSQARTTNGEKLDRQHAAEVSTATRVYTAQTTELQQQLEVLGDATSTVQRCKSEIVRLQAVVRGAARQLEEALAARRQLERAASARWCALEESLD